MRAVVMKGYGGNEVLALCDVPMPAVQPHDVLIQVVAASVNPLDFKIRDGKLRMVRKYPLPIVIGNDLAGRVSAVGRSVTGFRVGDEVYARVDKDKLGAFAEFAAVDESFVAKKPTSLDFEAAAGVPLVALTAWQALHEEFKLSRGQTVFIPAGAGGVGGMAIQLAKLAGARVVTTASGDGLALVKRLGADEAIDYKAQDPKDVVSGVDAVFDLLGGKALMASFRMLKAGGKVVSIAGIPTADTGRRMGKGVVVRALFHLASAKFRRAAREAGGSYEYLFMRPDGAQLKEIASLIDAGKLTTIVDRVFPLAQAKEALVYAETGRAKGKIVLRVAD